MKYMGSKRAMLRNGLGELILREAGRSERIVDLFCGAGSVSWFSAENTPRSVVAIDLQHYAAVLCQSVVGRDFPIDSTELSANWLTCVVRDRNTSPLWRSASALEQSFSDTQELVREARLLCGSTSTVGPIWNAYGGHYFSPSQALTFDYMLRHLPEEEPERSACLAATATTASRCAAAPGHTAQPFKPVGGAAIYLRKSWARDPITVCNDALHNICTRYAQTPGEAFVADALDVASDLSPGDLVIVDPPYSSVQYSRFYHVLETVVRGRSSTVNGIGRYPPLHERPQSDFSKKTSSRQALEHLITALSVSGATIILTFPNEQCSNGLSGDIIREVVGAYYNSEEKIVAQTFSTLGGNNHRRDSRKASNELLILLRPKT
jgi:adenine-specific DNA-methyltransferase